MAILKQVTMNVPLVKILEQIQGYAKFMKDFLMKKSVIRWVLVDNLYYCSIIITRSFGVEKGKPRSIHYSLYDWVTGIC